ncbi:MAG: PDZ domain-containing protein [Tahibacter sp.]
MTMLRMKLTCCSLICAALAAGCSAPETRTDADMRSEPIGVAEAAVDRYDSVSGREPEVIADLRAAPAPAQAEIIEGKIQSADERLLTAQGFVRIGDSRHAADDPQALQRVREQAVRVGADKVLTYPHITADPVDGSATATLRAAYFVRLRLPFGASFRDLSPTERKTLPGGVCIGSVIGNSPASEANLGVGDYITQIDGKSVDNKQQFQALLKDRAGKTVQLTIQRNGETLTRAVRLGKFVSNR